MYIKLKQAFFHDRLFSISLLLAFGTSFISIPKMGYIDWKVICCLFNLSAILLALDELHVLDRISIKILTNFHHQRSLSLSLIALTFISSMLITNDMALLTFVPLTLIIARKANFDPGFTIILQALGANIGSSISPLGNPQNLFLFSYYHLTLEQFLLIMLPFVVLGGFWLWILNHKTKNHTLEFEMDFIYLTSKRKVIIYLLLFGCVFLSVMRVIDYRLITILVLLVIILMDRQLLKRIDYCLLGTFVCFFIIVGNLSQLELLNRMLNQSCMNSSQSYVGSILLSQIFSNVPAAIFIAHFTQQWQAVLLGVNVGGLGTLIASMASVIAFRLYIREYPNPSYLSRFLFYNLVSLFVFSIAMYYLVMQSPL